MVLEDTLTETIRTTDISLMSVDALVSSAVLLERITSGLITVNTLDVLTVTMDLKRINIDREAIYLCRILTNVEVTHSLLLG